MIVIKLLTLNAHSFLEDESDKKLGVFVKAVLEQSPDVIALQEVSQTNKAQALSDKALVGFKKPNERIIVRDDNYVYRTIAMLSQAGEKYYWCWLPIKQGYERLDEGIAILTKKPILSTSIALVSKTQNYKNFKTRKILGVTVDGNEWFYCVHYGWWNDKSEPFFDQWERTLLEVSRKGRVWLMGDFNNPYEVRHEGYDLVSKSGFHDTFLMAKSRDNGVTVIKAIDGWRDRALKKMRIDQIWCSERVPIKSSRTIFNGRNYPVVSDHYGVLLEVREGTNEKKKWDIASGV